MALAREDSAQAAEDPETRPLPVIAPMCPAVVNLIELRFPSLIPQLAPFDSPWEALQAAHSDRRLAYVVSCPSQRSALMAHESADTADSCVRPGAVYLSPQSVRGSVMTLLGAQGQEPAAAGSSGPTPTDPAVAAPAGYAGADDGHPADPDELLVVTGMEHVTAVLEQIENGLLTDVAAVELYACAGGCFGSPLLPLDFHVTARRWAHEQGLASAADAPVPGPRRLPYAARPGIRLDANMARAIEKLGQLQALARALPGKDCGTCGAPTCAALAEDIVMGRATTDLCPYSVNEKEACS